ncbi:MULTISPECIES: ABC transporter substrate-binding protein [Enterocloster]|uniref:Peptide/nickel transport system substrate-binding protein n=1 Tax=Enterocloster lavalensis TaxID=460384 RepID=A0A1I0D7T1_9FIRM|nr:MULTISPECIES: ABC transporter substrate-binding protein [Enterocloster]MDR3755257.1 ABC transporter substrate-binding protein [Enterocloster sp.]PST35344.1 ABC transporter substrate-binding protein [Enterocloster lavalensis]SET27578.1 peptide/nickel transport system substrate-binding protein [Enterocloster lavalensis]
MRYNIKTLLAVGMAAAVLTACSGGGTETKDSGQTVSETDGAGGAAVQEADSTTGSKDSVIVVMGPTSEPEAGFDPAYGWGAGEHVHEPLIQSTLTVTTTDLKIGYDLATDMEASEDGLTWTVKIRDDASFTDGEKLTAADVVFTYNTLRDTSSVNDFTMLDRAEAVDDTTVRFYLKRPYSIWPYTMAIVGILPEHAYGPDYGEHPVGSGRYILKQWDRGQQVIFEANPDYYGEAPKMRKVTVLFMEEDAAFAAVMAGQADIAYTAASYSDQTVPGYELLAFDTVDNRGFNLPAIPAGSVSEQGVPLGNDFTSDVLVRRAINIGIDRDEMIEHVLNGYGSPAYSVCDKMPWYEPDAQVKYDPAGAAALLDEAGWTPGADGIRTKDGLRAELTFLYPASDSVRQALAADSADQLRKLGIDTKTEGVDWDTAYTRAQSEPLLWGWGAHTPMELYNIYHTMEKTGLAEYSPYANQTVDRYMDEALAESDLEASYELWKKAQWDGTAGITQEGDIPWIWLVNIDHLYWSREGLQVAEQKLHPHGHGWSIVNNVDQWSWK